MKLAEALQERADLNRRIAEIGERVRNNCLVQEGEKPDEDPKELIRELDGCIDRLASLMAGINKTNNATVVDGRTLTELIAEKDALSVKIAAYKSFVGEAGQKTSRARFSEIKILSTVEVAELQKRIDTMSKRLRLLDNTLQSANWTTEYIEQ